MSGVQLFSNRHGLLLCRRGPGWVHPTCRGTVKDQVARIEAGP
jgi:hypothetical protein